MDKLQKCAKAFENLLEIQYRIIIGRKGKTAELVIGFSKLDFHHLMGLGKLKDLRIAKQNRGSVFDEIITGITTYETLTKSRYLAQIENRFEPLALVEQLLDDNRLVFRYNTKLNQFSLIEADYLLSTPFENSDIYIFIAEHKDTGKYFCRSFFPKEKKDYTEGQPRYTMLYKEKRNISEDIWGLLRICKDGLKIISSCNILLSVGIPIFSKDWLATRLVSPNLFRKEVFLCHY